MTGILVNAAGLHLNLAIGLAVRSCDLVAVRCLSTHAGLGETATESCLLQMHRSEHEPKVTVGSVSYLYDGEGNDESIWALPYGFPCFSLIIIWYSATRIVIELPPLAIFAGRKTKKVEMI